MNFFVLIFLLFSSYVTAEDFVNPTDDPSPLVNFFNKYPDSLLLSSKKSTFCNESYADIQNGKFKRIFPQRKFNTKDELSSFIENKFQCKNFKYTEQPFSMSNGEPPEYFNVGYPIYYYEIDQEDYRYFVLFPTQMKSKNPKENGKTHFDIGSYPSYYFFDRKDCESNADLNSWIQYLGIPEEDGHRMTLSKGGFILYKETILAYRVHHFENMTFYDYRGTFPEYGDESCSGSSLFLKNYQYDEKLGI